MANGTDAITIALRAMGVGPGDEVLVPSFTFYASAEAIPPTGATPVFCDIDPQTFCITAETVRAALTPAHQGGHRRSPVRQRRPVQEIEALGVPVLEDAAQAAGSTLDGVRAGALGTAATFSFYPSKNLGCFGDGGAITTDDESVAERARTLRFHGSRDKVTYQELGYNSRLDALQAAILRVQLPHLDAWAAGRRAGGEHYEAAGLGELVELPARTAGCDAAWHLYVVQSERAEELRERLAAAGIEARAYYRTPMHRQPAMAPWAAGVELPVHRGRRGDPPGAADEPRAERRAGEVGRRRGARLAPALEQVVVADAAHDARRNTHHDGARGTSETTTAPAATYASSPISTPGASTAPPPMRHARRRRGPASC